MVKTKRFSRKFLALVLLGLAMLWSPQLALAVWPSDPTVNVAICDASDNQESPVIISDGSGGAIICFATCNAFFLYRYCF